MIVNMQVTSQNYSQANATLNHDYKKLQLMTKRYQSACKLTSASFIITNHGTTNEFNSLKSRTIYCSHKTNRYK